jgi:serine/threonine protein kinase
MLNGSTTASDIWSVGCLAIELYSGNPPYSYLEPMAAMFKIASDDDYFPYPIDSSKEFIYFLTSCFQRDPNLRISARRLINHSFITGKFFGENSFHGKVSSTKKQISIARYRENVMNDDDYSGDFEIIGDDILSLHIPIKQEPIISDDEDDNHQVFTKPSDALNQTNIFYFANNLRLLTNDSVLLRECISSLNEQVEVFFCTELNCL